MLAVWSLWCAVCVDPYPSVVIFVLTFEFIIMYVLVKSRNFDDFSKLLGLDYSSLVAAAEYSIRYHACELHELPHDLLDALHIPDGEDYDEMSVSLMAMPPVLCHRLASTSARGTRRLPWTSRPHQLGGRCS